MTHKTAIKQGLEPVYPESHELGEWVFYDTSAGRYYDAGSDMYLEDTDYKLPGNYYSNVRQARSL